VAEGGGNSSSGASGRQVLPSKSVSGLLGVVETTNGRGKAMLADKYGFAPAAALFNVSVSHRFGSSYPTRICDQQVNNRVQYGGTWLMEPLGHAFGNLFSSLYESFNPAGMQLRLLNTYSSKFATALNLSVRGPLAAALSKRGGCVSCFCGTDRTRDERRGSIPSFRIL
jgi:hypothetical protein